MHTKILARAGGDGWWGSNPQVNFSHCAFLLIQANITGWQGGLQVRKRPRVTNHKNTPMCKIHNEAMQLHSSGYLDWPGRCSSDRCRDTQYVQWHSMTSDALLKVSVFWVEFPGLWFYFSTLIEMALRWFTATRLSENYLPVSEPRFSTHFLSWPSTPIIKLIRAPLVRLLERGGETGPGHGRYHFGKCVW